MSVGHWPAILVAALAAWFIGALWYSPVLFAKPWVKAHGFTPEQLTAMKARAPIAYGGSFFAFILIAFVLNLFLNHLGADSLRDGLGWGFHAWAGFALPLTFIATMYQNKSMASLLIDTGYQLIYLSAMGAILGAWR
ncbi:MAG: DUF1761 domain-containing protein [Gemmatimonadota bacterium]